MELQGTVIDVGRGAVSFENLGVKDLPLVRTSRRHLAVRILDFPAANLDPPPGGFV